MSSAVAEKVSTERKTKYLTCAETAKLLRAALRESFGEKFPDAVFSVQSKSYAGGASITIYWQDGPTEKMVDAVANRFSGADFDSMQDMKTYREDTIIDGVPVHFGADYIFTSRSYGREILEGCAAFVSFDLRCPPPVVEESAWSPGNFSFKQDYSGKAEWHMGREMHPYEIASCYARRAYFEEVEGIGPVLMLEEK